MTNALPLQPDRAPAPSSLADFVYASPLIPSPIRSQPLPTTGAYPPLVAIVGAHGGAATSTLARFWAPAADSGQCWPASTVTTQRVVLAARLCMPGLVAAADRLREWRAEHAPAGVTVVALVLTPPRPGRVPAEVRRYRDLVANLIDEHVFNIDWHDELIACELVDLAEWTPGQPVPRRRRRRRITESVPADVIAAGAAITRLIAASRHLSDTSTKESPC